MRTPATSSSRWSRRAVGLLALAALAHPIVARAQAGDEIPAITASPVERDAPNGGQWFVVEGDRGQTVEVVAQVANPADQAQAVRLYLADLAFDGDQATVGDADAGIGAWGGFDEPELTLDAHEVASATFRLTVPADAEPGDHIGAVVAESGVSGDEGGVGVIKRIASRLYVTVPGDALASVEIDELETRLDRSLLPRHVIATFLVRNTGNVRLETEVSVNGRHIEGPPLVMSQSAEAYETLIPLSVWGGSKSIDVRVISATSVGEGPTDVASTSVRVIPWWILLAAFLLVVGALTLRELAKRLR